jgi:uncharacterized membrane protein
MRETVVILFWWILFGGAHIVMSSTRWRPKLVARFGERGFLVVYSLVALITFSFLAHSYAHHKHAGLQLWHTFGGNLLYLIVRDLNVALMAFAFILLVSGLIARPPSSIMPAGGIPEPYGVTRITRHPTFAAFWLFGIAHCLVNGSLADLVFFGGLSVFAWIGAAHQDSRKIVTVPGYAEFTAATSFVPFAAIMKKKQPLPLHELSLGVVALALLLFYLVRAYHPSIFGGVLMSI